MRTVALVSGYGSTLEYFDDNGFAIACVIGDRSCRAFKVAEKAGILALWLPRGHAYDFNRDRYTEMLLRLLEEQKIDFVLMMGFMTPLGPAMFTKYRNRVLNSHPSLLPAFPGQHAIRDTLAAKPRPKKSGCSIILADEGSDTGKVIAQAEVPVSPVDVPATLRARIQSVEKPLYLKKALEEIEKLRRS